MNEPAITAAISAQGIEKRFGSFEALKGIDFELPQGATLSLFGSNGAGKTTLLRILSTLSRHAKGTLTLFGENTAENVDVLRLRIGMISHKPSVYAHLTAQENLILAAQLYGVVNPKERSQELLELVELGHRAHDEVYGFSRGMLQRLAIARALIHDPDLLLLDEPYSGLDAHAVELFDEIFDQAKQGKTIVLVSHEVEKSFEFCTHALILAQGRRVAFVEKDKTSYEEFYALYKKAVGVVS